MIRRLLLLLLLCASSAFAQTGRIDIVFCGTSNCNGATIPNYMVVDTGFAYPHSFTNVNGVSISAGLVSSGAPCGGLNHHDTLGILTPTDIRLSGYASTSNNNNVSNQCIYRIAVTTGINISTNLAFGYPTAAIDHFFALADNGTRFVPMTNRFIPYAQNAPGPGMYLDANGILWNGQNWGANNTPIVHNFSGVFDIVLGPDTPSGFTRGDTGSVIASIDLNPSTGLIAPIITPSVPPAVPAGSTFQFSASNCGTGCTWTVSGSSAGSVNSSGLYTAPAAGAVTAKQSCGGWQCLQNNHVFNTRIDSLSVHASSATWMTGIGASAIVFEEFVSFSRVDNTTPTVSILSASNPFTATVGSGVAYARNPWPIPSYPSPQREGGILTSVGVSSNQDTHENNCNMDTGFCEELYNFHPVGGDATCPTCNVRTFDFYQNSSYGLLTSGGTDAGSLPILPLSL